MNRMKIAPLIAAVFALSLGAAACSEAEDYTDPDDPLASEQYALDRLNMRDAWAQSDGSGAVIAIIDTGIDL
ncbi:MAG: peptidase S8, partial [Actinomycetota bacterium]